LQDVFGEKDPGRRRAAIDEIVHQVELDLPANRTIDDLLWWTKALKTARASATTLE
jgi:hypothetical protein